jgi:hypothetical protein
MHLIYKIICIVHCNSLMKQQLTDSDDDFNGYTEFKYAECPSY